MLTPKQKAVLEFIQSFSQEKGYAPSQREIADHFGFTSLGTVQNYLVRLERHGLLRKSLNAKRATEVIALSRIPSPPESSPRSVNSRESENVFSLQADPKKTSTKKTKPSLILPSSSHRSISGTDSSAAVPLPLLGRVAAGKPLEYVETDTTVDVPVSMLRKSDGTDHFVLRVQGQSMIEDGILDGDYVVIQKQKDAERGQTVVAMVGNEATIKRFYRQGSKIELRPANERFEPIFIDSLTDSRDFRIEGVLVGVIRKMAF